MRNRIERRGEVRQNRGGGDRVKGIGKDEGWMKINDKREEEKGEIKEGNGIVGRWVVDPRYGGARLSEGDEVRARRENSRWN